MENSTSLRFLEASGRPSGTGRPSLPPPRADAERADNGRESTSSDEARRKSRPRATARKVPAAAEAPQPKPFEKLLGDAQETAPAENSAEQTLPATATETSAKSPSATKAKKATAPAHAAGASQTQPAVELESPLQLLAANVQPVQLGEARSQRLRPDALALPATATVTLASAAPKTEDAAALQDVGASTDPAPADAALAPLVAAADLAQASTRDGSLLAQPVLTPESRLEPAATIAVKAPPPPAPPPAESERAGEILRQMRVLFSPELRTATIQLSPPELGRISIRMRVEDGELHAVVRADKRETLDALQRHVPELKATLESIGIQAKQFDLQLGFEQPSARQDPSQARQDGRAANANEHDPQVREHERRLLRTLSARTGGIDTYA